ncbi:MAG: DUF488 family protein [Owenweeksia sp.]|nr:DUF488 family protein [Owenweeksia sp.]
MYYRRKIVLALLEQFGNELEKLKLQKLLMLYCRWQEKPAYQFVPYRYGCFSFQANADLKTLIKYNEVEERERVWRKVSGTTYTDSLKGQDRQFLRKLYTLYSQKSANELIHLTYTRYPYFAIKSGIAERHLNAEEMAAVEQEKPVSEEVGIYTIGYEGVSLEEYLNKLIHHDIKVLCDVRRNAMSMKYGFSKSQLQNACEGLGIQYIHIPEVGIASDKRKKLECQEDYDHLFVNYIESTLKSTADQQMRIIDLVKKYQRVALTCFEKDICQCHRKPLAESIANRPEFDYQLRQYLRKLNNQTMPQTESPYHR